MNMVAVLIAAPASRAIDESVIETLRSLGAGPPRWLASAEAAEFDDFPGLADFDAAARSLDLALVPRHNRRKRLLLADMDSTMIEQECMDELAP